jgi:hypothetical protein
VLDSAADGHTIRGVLAARIAAEADAAGRPSFITLVRNVMRGEAVGAGWWCSGSGCSA